MNRIYRPLLLLALLASLASCSSEKVDVMVECSSPSGQLIATLYRVSSGESARDKAMKLNIRSSQDPFKADMDSFSFRHGYDGILHWQSDASLRIDYPADSELLHQEPVVFGTSQTFSDTARIQLIYKEVQSTHGYFMVEKRCFNK